MTNKEKIERIQEIYSDFLVELNKLKAEVSQNTQAKIKSIEKKKIDDILDKIHNQL